MSLVGFNTPIYSKKSCVVYDSSSGKIHHLHNVVTFVGGSEPSEEQIEADALQVVAGLHRPPGGDLRVLHIPHGSLLRGKSYRVDVEKKELI